MRVRRPAVVQDKTGLARTTLYKYVDAGPFPRPICLGGRAGGWIDSEVHE